MSLTKAPPGIGVMRTQTTNEYVCDKHQFKTTDPKKALKHIEADLVDEVFNFGAKITKAYLGLV